MITLTKTKPPLERGDLYLILPDSPHHAGLSDLEIGKDYAISPDESVAILRLVERHKCGALEFVVTKAGARPE